MSISLTSSLSLRLAVGFAGGLGISLKGPRTLKGEGMWPTGGAGGVVLMDTTKGFKTAPPSMLRLHRLVLSVSFVCSSTVLYSEVIKMSVCMQI